MLTFKKRIQGSVYNYFYFCTKWMQCNGRCEHDKATWHALAVSVYHILYFQAACAGEVIICLEIEDGGSRLLLNIGVFVPEYTPSRLRLLIFTNVKFSDSSEVVSTVYFKELELGCYINRKTYSCVCRLI
jgi:hypothetical protein